MSLANNKNSLFGDKKAAGGSSSTSSAPPTTHSAPVSKTAGSNLTSKFSGATSGISIIQKKERIEEAKALSERGMAQLKTSMFQWKPDHLAAAPLFEQSAEKYKLAGEFNQAMAMMVKCAESNEGYGSLAAAALAMGKAAGFAKEGGNKAKGIEYLKKAADFWGISGDIQRYGETLFLAAKEIEAPNEAKLLYLKAIEVLCPESTPESQLGQIHPASLELLRNACTFLVINKFYKEAMALSKRMAAVFKANEAEGSMCKAMLAVIILQLTLGDYVLANQVYLDQLSNNQYLHSKECEVADLLTSAFNNRDVEALDKAQIHPHLSYLDRPLQDLVKRFSVLEMDEEEDNSGPQTKAPVAAAGPSKESLFSRPTAPATAATATSKPASSSTTYSTHHKQHAAEESETNNSEFVVEGDEVDGCGGKIGSYDIAVDANADMTGGEDYGVDGLNLDDVVVDENGDEGEGEEGQGGDEEDDDELDLS